MKYFSQEVRTGKFLKDVVQWNTTEEECWNRAFSGESFAETRGTQQRRFFPVVTNEIACQFFKIYSAVEVEQQQQTETKPKEVACDSSSCNETHKANPKRTQTYHPLNESGILLWSLELDGRFTKHSDMWTKFTGSPFDDSAEWGWIKCHQADDRDCMQTMWKEVSKEEVSNFRYNTRLWSMKEQQYRHVLIHVTKKDKEWFCVGLDIHDMKQSKRKLARLASRMKQALRAANVGTWEYDITNDILTAGMKVIDVLTLVDTQVYRLFGLHTEPPMGHTWTQFLEAINPEDRPATEKQTEGCVTTGTPYNAEFRVQWEDGSIHWLVGKGRRLFCKEGKPFILGVNWDITASKEAERQHVTSVQQQEEIRAVRQAAELERQHKVFQEEFMDTICHEIRNPLVGIYGSVSSLRDQLNDMKEQIAIVPQQIQKDAFLKICESVADCLESIHQCAEQQKVIVDDVLDYSKLEACKIELNPSPFNIKSCINTVLQMFSSKIKEKGLHIKVDIPTDDWIKADIHRLQQVITNLVSNSVKFTNEGEISIEASVNRVSSTESILAVKVQDTGIGISESELPNLFERFSQAKRTSATYGGTGLGLAISKRLVEAMGGNITVHSQQGVGSTFEFTIKCQNVLEQELEQLPVAKRKASMDKRCYVGQKSILIVDDNAMNRKILAHYLEKEGHLCRTANNGLEALEKCQQEYYDLIFMDIEMPIMNGLEATRNIREKDKVHRPIVGLSGNARKEKIEAAFQAGMDEYLTKPYNREDIVSVINKMLMQTEQQKKLKTSEVVSK